MANFFRIVLSLDDLFCLFILGLAFLFAGFVGLLILVQTLANWIKSLKSGKKLNGQKSKK